MVGAHRVDGGQDRPGTGDEHQAEADPEHESSGIGALTSTAQPGEGAFEEIAHRRHNEPQADHAQDHQSDPPQEVQGQVEGGQQPRPGEREHGEAEYQPTHHGERSPPARCPREGGGGSGGIRRSGAFPARTDRPAGLRAGGGPTGTGHHQIGSRPEPVRPRRTGLIVVQRTGCAGGEYHRDDGEDAGGDAAHQTPQEPDQDQHEHGFSVPSGRGGPTAGSCSAVPGDRRSVTREGGYTGAGGTRAAGPGQPVPAVRS